jgi:hypothetical protein
LLGAAANEFDFCDKIIIQMPDGPKDNLETNNAEFFIEQQIKHSTSRSKNLALNLLCSFGFH